MSEVEGFVQTIAAHQEEIADKRTSVADELVAHVLQLPGMAEIFDTDVSKQMLGQQLVNTIEFASRQKAELAAMPAPEVLPEATGNGSSEA